MEFTPTAEQQAALDLFASGDSMVIQAGAGTGKTSTLKLLGLSTGKQGLYVAFNKAIVEEAQAKMPPNVVARTVHSLAYATHGKKFRHRLNAPRMRSDKIAKILDIGPVTISVNGKRKVLQPGFLASIVMQGVTFFCQTDQAAPTVRNLPYIEGIDMPKADGSRGWTMNDQVREHLDGAIERAWADVQRLDGQLPFRHEHYLKLWQLSGPKLKADFILFDEAQDANPVMAAVVGAQAHAQRVYVGDSQQAIYEFTGAVDALAGFAASHQKYLTQSFRFGPAIAGVANQILSKLGAELRLLGAPGMRGSSLGELRTPRAILCRTNAGAFSTMLDALDSGVSAHLIGGGKEVASFARAALDLQGQKRTAHPELSCFDTWTEVLFYVEHDPAGSELTMMVNLVEKYGADVLLKALEGMPAEKDATTVVSTAHKAKGREWETVQLHRDFLVQQKDGDGQMKPRPWTEQELRLLYVACTRAQQHLDHTAVAEQLEMQPALLLPV